MESDMTDLSRSASRRRQPKRNASAVFAVLLTGASVSCATSSTTVPANAIGYTCDAGKIQIERTADSVTLTVQGERSLLPRVEAASGAKYSDGKLTWWEKGDSGFVMQDESITLRDCRKTP